VCKHYNLDLAKTTADLSKKNSIRHRGYVHVMAPTKSEDEVKKLVELFGEEKEIEIVKAKPAAGDGEE